MRLGEVCTINPKAPAFEDDLLVSFVPMPKVGENGEFDPSEEREYQSVKKGFTYFSEGDVLFAKITPCMENGKGAVARALRNGIGYGSTEFHVLRPVDGKVLSDWLYYLTSWSVFRKEAEKNMTGSAGQKRVPKAFLENYSVRVPEIGKQTVQVEALKRISKLIGLRKQQLEKLDELVKARFVEMFGDPVENDMNWQTEVLDSICSTIVDCPHSTPSYTAENTGYMCIRTSIVKKNRILWDQIEYIPEHEYRQRIQRKKPEKGDIVYTREGAILGIAAIIDRDCNVALGQRSMLLSPDTSKCLPQFLSTAMNFDSFLRKALGGISGSASPHINVGDIKAFSIIMPPIELQAQFAAFVEQTDKSKAEIKKSLEQLETLKKALMQKYFS